MKNKNQTVRSNLDKDYKHRKDRYVLITLAGGVIFFNLLRDASIVKEYLPFRRWVASSILFFSFWIVSYLCLLCLDKMYYKR